MSCFVVRIVRHKKSFSGSARTGSGKTIAFLVPVVELICSKLKFKPHNGTGSLIIAPTRELATQIFETLEKLMVKHTPTYGLIIGGENRKIETKKLEHGVSEVFEISERSKMEHRFLFKND